MIISETINEDMKVAMKAKDQAALRTIRSIKSAFQMVLTDGSGKELDSAKEVQILQKLLKQRQESLSIYEAQNREDLAAIEREEIKVLEKYLPRMLSQEELTPIIAQIISDVQARSLADMGKVMGVATKQLRGKANGQDISIVVRTMLK